MISGVPEQSRLSDACLAAHDQDGALTSGTRIRIATVVGCQSWEWLGDSNTGREPSC